MSGTGETRSADLPVDSTLNDDQHQASAGGDYGPSSNHEGGTGPHTTAAGTPQGSTNGAAQDTPPAQEALEHSSAAVETRPYSRISRPWAANPQAAFNLAGLPPMGLWEGHKVVDEPWNGIEGVYGAYEPPLGGLGGEGSADAGWSVEALAGSGQ